MTSYAYDAWCDAQGKLYIPYFLIDFSLIQSANMIFPALRRKKKTQKRNQPLSYWIEGWFYLTIEFFNIYYGFLNLLAILNSLMVLFKESICPGVKVLISSTILRSLSGFWLSEAKNSSGVISKYLQIYRKPSIEGRFCLFSICVIYPSFCPIDKLIFRAEIFFCERSCCTLAAIKSS